jgi:hypothetical protein
VDQLIERCAGLDVHKASVTACVRVPGEDGARQQQIRTFRTTTAGLVLLGDWLASFAVTVVGMESTGVYWKPCYWLLEDDFQCWLLNARHLRNVPGRKTDVKDAAWICQLARARPGATLVRAAQADPGSCATSPATARRWCKNVPARRSGCTSCWRTPGSSCPAWPATPWGCPAG